MVPYHVSPLQDDEDYISHTEDHVEGSGAPNQQLLEQELVIDNDLNLIREREDRIRQLEVSSQPRCYGPSSFLSAERSYSYYLRACSTLGSLSSSTHKAGSLYGNKSMLKTWDCHFLWIVK